MSLPGDTSVAPPPAETAEPRSHHAYPVSAMAGDYLRAAAGFVPSAALLATVPTGAVATVILGGLAAVFALFGLRTLYRQGTRIEITDRELRTLGPRPQVISWDALDRLKLAYYSVRRDRHGGWMQLELGAGRTRIQLDSRIGGFDEVVRRAAEAARARGLELGDATLANLEALGITAPHHAGPFDHREEMP